MNVMKRLRFVPAALLLCTLIPGLPGGLKGQEPEFPPFEKVAEGYEQVISLADGSSGFYTLWKREKDGQMLAELPRGFEKQRHFVALTVSSGETFSGLQAGDMYVYWKQYGNRLALVAPNYEYRSTGDAESKVSVNRIFTDRVLLDVPILSMRPKGGPIIDLDFLLLNNAAEFFGSKVNGINPRLATIVKAKSFPQNIEVAYEVPMAGGVLKTLHYSISLMPENTGYTPRAADERIGYFTTAYRDLGKYSDDETTVRYINRWRLEKADPSLKLSPPKKPIVFYIESTTPIRYRRFVRDGILMWNRAFEKIGIVGAVEVYFQDAQTGAHMEKDPEDVRYNFIRWLNNDVGTAIGPSRVHPMTGEILDADVVLTDGWIRHYDEQFHKVIPKIAMEGFGPEALTWFDSNPQWDPRILLAPAYQKPEILAHRAAMGPQPLGGHPMANLDTPEFIGDDHYDGLVGRLSQVNGYCECATAKSMDLMMLRMTHAMVSQNAAEGGKPASTPSDDDDDDEVIDGIPSRFLGPLLADLVCHEVGHTLGLRHNFRGSSIYTFDEINSDELRGKKAFASSIMDYVPINFVIENGEVAGDYAMIDIGPYDYWAIEFGYGPDSEVKKVLSRSTEPELTYGTDEDTSGPDPRDRRYDFSSNPLDYANFQMDLARFHRERLLDEWVKDGDSWAKSRQGYDMTLSLQTRALSMMGNWLGGVFTSRAKKGDGGEGAVDPIRVVPAADQRAALAFLIANAFEDEAFGLTPEMLRHFAVDKWMDLGQTSLSDEATYPVHDRIMAIQASVLSYILNPTTLRRVQDNEFRVDDTEEMFTLAEILDAVKQAAWTELEQEIDADALFDPRTPMISSLRRNLQRQHVSRLIALSLENTGNSALRTVTSLARRQLRQLNDEIGGMLQQNGEKMDAYTHAHLEDLQVLIAKTIDAQVIVSSL